MSFGKNLQYLRQLSKNMTQEALAEKLNVSRQTISKWEMDAANPEMDKALEICKIFNCTLDNLFREEMDKRSDAYSNLRVEDVTGFRYIAYTVISTEPESDTIGRMYKIAKEESGKFSFRSRDRNNVNNKVFDSLFFCEDGWTPEQKKKIIQNYGYNEEDAEDFMRRIVAVDESYLKFFCNNALPSACFSNNRDGNGKCLRFKQCYYF